MDCNGLLSRQGGASGRGVKVRIIAGQWRGLRLHAPEGSLTRPTTDRVKEAMFSLMGSRWSSGLAVDLFAGSGALGLEALSRGADGAVLVDHNRWSIQTIRQNADKCRTTDKMRIWQLDWRVAWRRLQIENASIGWVFVDPPYATALWPSVLEVVACSEIEVQDGVVCEHPVSQNLLETYGRLRRTKYRCYGEVCVSVYRDVKTGEVNHENRGLSGKL
ncbi:16S rRNA (guanine(966)-N(2))-methyltransferase RsmD [Alicyclobacillaceae bacterium I2511]|nr:16S rRNA (guanine(966)-N(2))-methyltransferase RsmD [Alicyclobacillaceae bacterium I2511]